MKLLYCFGLLLIILLAGCVEQETSTKSELKEVDFSIVSATWTDKNYGVGGIETTLENQCKAVKCRQLSEPEIGCPPPIIWSDEYQKSPFIVTIKTEDFNPSIPSEKKSCYAVLDGRKYYSTIELTANDMTDYISSSFFCKSEAFPNTGTCPVGSLATLDVTKNHELSFCCGGICKIITLNAYCP